MKKLIIGTAQFGSNYGINNKKESGFNKKEAAKFLNYAYSKNIKILDTALNYKLSNKILSNSDLKKFQVITKIKFEKNFNKHVFTNKMKILQDNLKKLKIKSYYGLLVHNPEILTKKSGKKYFEFLKLCKKRKITKKIGISTYGNKYISNVCRKYKIDILQTTFNIFDTRIKKRGLLKRIKKKKIEVHARSIFLQGLLLMNEKKRLKKFKNFSMIWEKWSKYLEKNNINQYQACVNYAFKEKLIDRFIVGFDNLDQLKKMIFFNKNKLLFDFNNNNIGESLLNPYQWKFK